MRFPKPGRYKDRIYLLPNILTSGNLFFGFFSIISTINGSFRKAGFAILIAMVFDLLDGRVARLTKSSSQFGEEFDSMADLVSFGVAPALLLFIWSGLNITTPPFQKFGWLAAFFFVACGALRLARYNVQPLKRNFVGLPIPVSAALISSGILLYGELEQKWSTEWLCFVIFLTLGLLMVSSIPYKSYKSLEIRERHPFPLLVSVILFVIIMAIRPEAVLFVLSSSYVLIGWILGILDRKKSGGKRGMAKNIISIQEKIGRGN